MESSHETEELGSKALFLQKLLFEANPTSQALAKRDTMGPFQHPPVFSGMLKAQSPLQQNTGNIVQTSLEMDWESSSEFLNSELRGSSDNFSGCIAQSTVKVEADVVKRNENCSAGHLDHRDHTYACIAQAKSAIKEEKGESESNLGPSWWNQPLCVPHGMFAASSVSASFKFSSDFQFFIPFDLLFLLSSLTQMKEYCCFIEVKVSQFMFLIELYYISYYNLKVDEMRTKEIPNQLINDDYYQVMNLPQKESPKI